MRNLHASKNFIGFPFNKVSHGKASKTFARKKTRIKVADNTTKGMLSSHRWLDLPLVDLFVLVTNMS